MISELRIAKSAYFYKSRIELSKTKIRDLFKNIRLQYSSPSNNVIYHVRETHVASQAVWSAISFYYERTPAFFDKQTAERERICGFLMLVEFNGHVGVFKAQLDLPSKFTSEAFDRLSTNIVDAAITNGGAIFERIRLRNMSVSRHALKTKTLEAENLEHIVGPAGASRFAPQGYTVRLANVKTSATPSTGRIAQSSEKVGFDDLIEYARLIINQLTATTNATSSFIRHFARAIELGAVPLNVRPINLSVDVAALITALYEERNIRFIRHTNGTPWELGRQEIDDVVSELNTVFGLAGTGKKFDIIRTDDHSKAGEISINRSSISLKSLSLPLSSNIRVERSEFQIGADASQQTLTEYINENNAFIILFSSPNLAYIDGTLFSDEGLIGGGEMFMRYLKTEPRLSGVASEKGVFDAAKTSFDANSAFGAIIGGIAQNDDVLVCDDLGDEWADFIGLETTSTPPSINFYHAKHGELSLGASQFHIAVSQAIKNLGRMQLPREVLPQKFSKWRETYNNDGERTAINRVIRGDAMNLGSIFDHIRSSPDSVRRVFIVTSSLSKRGVETAFNEITRGGNPSPYFVQLYWLLLSFFSACNEAGAFGCVVCQE